MALAICETATVLSERPFSGISGRVAAANCAEAGRIAFLSPWEREGQKPVSGRGLVTKAVSA